MDNIIPYDDITEQLKSPPTLAPRLNFFRLRLLRKHIIDQVKQIPHPAYPQHGWTGMVLQPKIFALINAVPFVDRASSEPRSQSSLSTVCGGIGHEDD